MYLRWSVTAFSNSFGGGETAEPQINYVCVKYNKSMEYNVNFVANRVISIWDTRDDIQSK